MCLWTCTPEYDLILKESQPLIVATERERQTKKQAAVTLNYEKP